MKKLYLMVLILMLTPLFVFGQLKRDTGPPDIATNLMVGQGRPAGLLGSLGLDPSKFHMSHSYQMSYLSGAGRNGTMGLYLNTMSYQFSSKFLMQLQLGMAHQPFGGNLATSSGLMNRPFVSGAQLKYQPNDKLLIQVDYRSLPYWNSGYYYRDSNSMFDWEN